MSNLKILYVEDDKHTRMFMEIFLKTFTPNVYMAIDGFDGLEKYKQYNPDIVITDIGMPKMDGITMSEKIKDLNQNQIIFIISAYQKNEYPNLTDNLKNIDFISKPIDMNFLEQKIKNYL